MAQELATENQMHQHAPATDATGPDVRADVTRHAATPAGPPTIFPCLSYRDAPAAIQWLGRAFGFEKVCAYPGPDGTIVHAELRLGNGMIMLGSPKGRQPSQNPTGGPDDWEQSIYIVLDDVDAHYARARAAGAYIVRELTDTDYGSRDYSARDPEGYLWNFGTYQPFIGHDCGESCQCQTSSGE
jgi:uncharacterized glyoxalase superfamily protein PhnB